MFEALIEIAAHFPWWVGVVLAVIAYFLLHNFAVVEVSSHAQLGQIGGMVGRQFVKNFAYFGQYLLPFVLLIGAAISFARGASKPRLQVTRARSLSVKRSKQKFQKSNVRDMSAWRQAPVLHNDVQVRHRVLQDPSDKLKPDSWSDELIKSLEWKRFEELCAGLFSAKGYDARTTGIGADGGIDIFLFRPGKEKPLGIVQCKSWKTQSVGVKPVRELFGVMAAEDIPLGVFISTGEFTADAHEFSQKKHIKLLTGNDLLKLIKELPQEKQDALLTEITTGDYTTPTCPSCGVKMVLRTARKGGNRGSQFWGCAHFPRCKARISIGRDSVR